MQRAGNAIRAAVGRASLRPRPSGSGVRATWWYTAGSAIGVSTVVLMVNAPRLRTGFEAVVFAVGAVAWLVAFVLICRDYRFTAAHERVLMTPARAVLLVVGSAFAVLAACIVTSPALGVSLVATIVCVLPWPPGIRGRVTALLTIALLVVCWLEATRLTPTLTPGPATGVYASLVFAFVLPATVVSMLWWWDIVRELDDARLTEGRLAAAQERLRLAGDVHDLQGHHLQVIALQLELAERLLDVDGPAAAEQVRAARRSVDEARDGTRALATRFRGVPLPDEIANAADLLRVSGLRVRVDIAADAAVAPADVLGPIVRESTTNILKHGGGSYARLTLVRDEADWRFTAENDPAPVARSNDGTGLVSMAARAEHLGGSLRVTESADTFVLDVRVPDPTAAP